MYFRRIAFKSPPFPFSINPHISLKHEIVCYFGIFAVFCSFTSNFALNTDSANDTADITRVAGA